MAPGPRQPEVYTRTYTAPSEKALVIFAHGFGEHSARFEPFHLKWLQRGISVFSFDMRGFGRTALDDAHKSPQSAYGKTSWAWQLADLEGWVQRLANAHRGVPLFLMGSSIGGSLALAFATRTTGPPAQETVALLSGVISIAPLIHFADPAPRAMRWVLHTLANLVPYMMVPAKKPAEWSSRDPAIVKDIEDDPLRKTTCSVRGLEDMLSGGEKLLSSDYKHWPKALPLLVIHGTGDKINDHTKSEEFVQRVVAGDKKLILYVDAYHDLVYEAEGVAERVTEDLISYVEAHLHGPVDAGSRDV